MEINFVFGYRTSMSMKNRDTWQFAHNYCGKLWFRFGLVMLPISIMPLLFVSRQKIDTVSIVGAVVCFAQIVPMFVSVILTEAALKRAFYKNGSKRQ